MTFTQPVFPLFLLLVLLGLRLLPPQRKWQLLLPASWLFYAWYSLPLLGLLGLATAVSFVCGVLMEKKEKSRRGWFLLGCISLLGILFVFKYLDFAALGIASLLRLAGAPNDFRGFGLILPMGISFYVFQTLSYLIDVYRREIPAERHFAVYALFVSFVPQLVAGPIERPADLLPQLRCPGKPMTAEGLRLLLRGYAKKVVIADTVAVLVDNAYAQGTAAGGLALTAATALFALQIYCDFSGYTDIARGCGALMGIRLSENFRRPYGAVTVQEFWRRWHISLTRWFRDYVYIPLGGSRRGRACTVRNILIVFLLSGLWHGADVKFLIWGGLHGLYLCLELWLKPRRFPLRRALTLLLVGIAWVFFRAASPVAALAMMKTICTDPAPLGLFSGLGISAPQALMVLGILPLLQVVEKLPPLSEKHRLRYLVLILLIFFCRMQLLTQGGSDAFIYFQF
ncbi:MAG: MBOAT family protein [Clostridiales bacterium]|nr:MBOAT family protein [Clostridiales bacterium]